MRQNKKLFSGAIGGFKKSQVVEYIEELNRKAKISEEQSEFQIARLEEQLSEIETKTSDYDEIKESLTALENEKNMLLDDVNNQKEIISALQTERDELAKRVAELERDYDTYKAKAEKYDNDVLNSGGILERAKAEAAKTISATKAEASEIIREATEKAKKTAQNILSDSEKQVAENIRKVKYLYRRRDELLSAFEKVKDAAGGFYESITAALTKNNEE